jgi:hypothetical protein
MCDITMIRMAFMCVNIHNFSLLYYLSIWLIRRGSLIGYRKCTTRKLEPKLFRNTYFHFLNMGTWLCLSLSRKQVVLKRHSRNWGLLEKPPIVQLLKNFPAFYGTRKFIMLLTRALHWSLSWARSIQSIPSHPISLRSILILSTHQRLGPPSCLLWLSHQYPICIPRLLHSCYMAYPPYPLWLDHSI